MQSTISQPVCILMTEQLSWPGLRIACASQMRIPRKGPLKPPGRPCIVLSANSCCLSSTSTMVFINGLTWSSQSLQANSNHLSLEGVDFQCNLPLRQSSGGLIIEQWSYRTVEEANSSYHTGPRGRDGLQVAPNAFHILVLVCAQHGRTEQSSVTTWPRTSKCRCNGHRSASTPEVSP